MRKIGIIGGIGPESTLDYYKGIIGAFRERNQGMVYPDIIIYSADLAELLGILEAKAWDKLVEWLLARIEALHRAGAEFAVIGSNTPHVVFDRVTALSPIPLLSIVEATCRRAESQGLKKLGLLGTKFTMQSDFFQKPFLQRGMTIVVPTDEEQQLIHHRLFSEIELGIVKDSTRQELLAIVQKMIARDAIDGLILGCTELPLILDRDEFGIPFLNTTAIHVEGIVEFCLGE